MLLKTWEIYFFNFWRQKNNEFLISNWRYDEISEKYVLGLLQEKQKLKVPNALKFASSDQL